MPEYPYTTEELAAELGIHPKTLRRKARPLGLGINVAGRAGYRYSDNDRSRLIESMRPATTTTQPRRRRRRAA